MPSETPTLQQWKYFTIAVEKGSLLGAAAACSADVALISRQIKLLEKALQEPLLERSRNGVRPTWVGQQKYKEAKELLAEFESLFSPLGNHSQRSNDIRIAIPASISELIVRPLADFEKSYSRSPLNIELISYEHINDIELENFHLIICIENLPNVRFIAYNIANISYGIFASPSFLKACASIDSPNQLELLPLIHCKNEKILLHGEKQSVTITVEPKIKVNSVSSLMGAATEGLGIAIGVPLWASEEAVRQAKLVRVLPKWEMPTSQVWLLKHSGKDLSPLEKLIPFLRSIWSNHPAFKRNSLKITPTVTEGH